MMEVYGPLGWNMGGSLNFPHQRADEPLVAHVLYGNRNIPVFSAGNSRVFGGMKKLGSLKKAQAGWFSRGHSNSLPVLKKQETQGMYTPLQVNVQARNAIHQ